MKKAQIIVISLVILAVGLSIVRIALSAAFSTSGIDLNQLQAEKDALQKENMLLREVVYKQSSLTHIASVATAGGFVDAEKNNRYVLGDQPAVAFKP